MRARARHDVVIGREIKKKNLAQFVKFCTCENSRYTVLGVTLVHGSCFFKLLPIVCIGLNLEVGHYPSKKITLIYVSMPHVAMEIFIEETCV